MKMICDMCKNKIDAVPFVYEHSIITNLCPISYNKEYVTHVKAKTICPVCGSTIIKTYEGELTKSDIEALALYKTGEKI